MTVKIVADSVSDLPPEVVKDLGITIVPLSVRLGEAVYRDGIDITAEEFYGKLAGSKVQPFTSAPTPGAFTGAYDKLAEEADGILVVTVSARLSATHEAAVQGIEAMRRKCRVEVVDSQWAVMAQGFIAMEAARAAQAGAGLDEVAGIARSNISRVEMLVAFDTLEYLRRGGRIGKAQALLGSMLKVNPMITMKDGVVEPAGRTRSRAKAVDHLYEHVVSYAAVEEIAVENGACPDEADELAKRLGAKFPGQRIYCSRTTPVIGAHTGPGALLVAIRGDKQKP
ncbi:DegV family protein [Chloroflexota bacterium]